MEAAGYNWTAGRNVCDWLSRASLRFSPAISITPPVRGSLAARPPTQRPQFPSQNSVRMHRGPLLRLPAAGGWIVIGCGEGVNEVRSSLGLWRTQRRDWQEPVGGTLSDPNKEVVVESQGGVPIPDSNSPFQVLSTWETYGRKPF